MGLVASEVVLVTLLGQNIAGASRDVFLILVTIARMM